MTQLIVSRASHFKRKQYFPFHTAIQQHIICRIYCTNCSRIEKVSILPTYRGNNFNVQDSIRQITHLITFHKPDIVLGEFNINALRDSPLLDKMRQYGYTLLRTEPTHTMGGLLDHVYI